MHEVTLRASVNKMDAHNLTIVLCPNLVKGSNPIRDSLMCLLDGGPSILVSNLAQNSNGNAGSTEGTTTLGMVIKLCIQRYYEIFDEVTDRNELVSANRAKALNVEAQSHPDKINPSLASGPGPVLPTHLSPEEGEDDADEDIDDTMLVMPIEPGFGPGKHRSNASVQWARGVQLSPPPVPYKSKKLRAQNFLNENNSAHTNDSGAGSASPPYATMSKVKPNINIESGAGTSGSRSGKRGSISIGRDATGKSVGAGVEALGVTAAGFFTPPAASPPVPGRRSSCSNDPSSA